jgi:hypothetical protein
MPMIGNQATQGRFLELDSLTASATDDYTLQLNGANFSPESVNNLLVSINGVIQGSSTMSLNGAVLTVGATLSSSDTIDFVRVFGNVGTVSTPTDGSVTANKIGTGAITNVKVADNASISGSKLGTDAVLQVKNFQTGASDTVTTTIPYDDTIPQITEGGEVMTLAFTPKSASSKLLINVITHISASVDSLPITALFVGTTANALATCFTHAYGSGDNPLNHTLNHFMTSGTASELTFRVRVGCNNAGTVTFNGRSGVRKYGGSLASSITITEIGG